MSLVSELFDYKSFRYEKLSSSNADLRVGSNCRLHGLEFPVISPHIATGKGRKTQVKEKRPCEEENQSSTAASGERPREDLVDNPSSALVTVKGNRPCVDLASSASAAAAAPASGIVEEQEVALMEIRMPDYAVMTDFEDDDKEASGFLHKYQGGHLVVGKFSKVVLEGPLNPNALTIEGILQWLKGEEEDVYPLTILMGERTGVFSLNHRHQLLLLLVSNTSPPFASLVSYISLIINFMKNIPLIFVSHNFL
ncbi:hypothetical protein Hanom_Chr05g00443601 [Helianthus anomalus]